MENIEDNSIIYWLPTYWAAHIFNDDYSGLSDDEENQIREFLENIEGHLVSADFEQEEFTPFPDAGQKACDCIPFTFYIQTEKKT